MTLNGWLQIAVFFALILLFARPMGSYMTRVFERAQHMARSLVAPDRAPDLSHNWCSCR